MPAKVLAFDSNRSLPPRHYTPIAMRGRLLTMPSRPDASVNGDSNEIASPAIPDDRIQKNARPSPSASNPQGARNEPYSLRW
jgi:hypothetical protein